MEKEEISYKGYVIYAKDYIDENGKNKWFWKIYKDNNFLMQDWKTIDGALFLTDKNQAINDAKKNIDSLIRTNS